MTLKSLVTPLLAVYLLVVLSAASQAAPKLSDYGNLPEIQMVAISPNGDLVAYRKVTPDQDRIAIYSLSTHKAVAALDVSTIQPNGLYFVNDNQLILRASTVTRVQGFRGRFEVSTAYAYDLNSKKIRQLLIPGEGPIYPGQSGLGSMLGLSADGTTAYMPAYVGDRSLDTPPYSLLRVNLARKGTPRIHSKGTHHTRDFFLDQKGNVLAQELYDEKSNIHKIRTKVQGKWVDIFTEETRYRSKEFAGVTPDLKSLVMIETDPKTERRAYYTLALSDGTIKGPLFVRPDADIAGVIANFQRVVYGIQYQSFVPSYEFFDAALNARVKAIQAQFPEHSVTLIDWTPDWNNIVVNVEGSEFASDYLLFKGDNAPVRLANSRPQIKAEDLHPIGKVTFSARDGLKIPTLVTIPQGAIGNMKNLPAVLMPHGGPESHDTISFDWMAQALANEGYLVIQPQFRGSDGFGLSHILAGRGEWGKKMQDDLTDAVAFFVNKGMIDPQRICIAGASYGGYAALAGGAFTPKLYNCVVSINGIGDIGDMLAFDKREQGSDSWVVSYMEDQFTNGEGDKKAMAAISPNNFADNFSAPVLLVHATDDKRVPVGQSRQMAKSLKKAKKNVKLVELKGEDHHLREGTTRLQTLEEMVGFINQHIGQTKFAANAN